MTRERPRSLVCPTKSRLRSCVGEEDRSTRVGLFITGVAFGMLLFVPCLYTPLLVFEDAEKVWLLLIKHHQSLFQSITVEKVVVFQGSFPFRLADLKSV